MISTVNLARSAIKDHNQLKNNPWSLTKCNCQTPGYKIILSGVNDMNYGLEIQAT
jgi:hypothetical protein